MTEQWTIRKNGTQFLTVYSSKKEAISALIETIRSSPKLLEASKKNIALCDVLPNFNYDLQTESLLDDLLSELDDGFDFQVVRLSVDPPSSSKTE